MTQARRIGNEEVRPAKRRSSDTSGVYAARITAVDASTPPLYDAQANFAEISVSGVRPANNPVTTLAVLDGAVDDPCLLLIDTDGTVLLWYVETIDHEVCPT